MRIRQRELHIDVETFCELDLKKVGTAAYVAHESFEVMLFAWSYDNEPVKLVDLNAGQKLPHKLLEDLDNPNVIKWAHNAAFELQTISKLVGYNLDEKQWRCTMVMAHSLSMMGALGAVGEVIGLPMNKQKMGAGTRLIGKFCKLRKKAKTKDYFRTYPADEPEAWGEFKSYCKQDVEAEKAIHKRLRKWDLPEHEWALWHMDQRINRRGLPIDNALIESAIELADKAFEDITNEIKNITGLDNPNSRDQLLAWLNERGAGFKDLTKNTIIKALKDESGDKVLSDEVRYVLEQRLEGNMASIKKFDALDRTKVKTEQGFTVSNCFQFAGAPRTWRWAGRIFQPQNIARGNLKPHQYDLAIEALKTRDAGLIETLYGSVNGLLTSLVRPAVCAHEGQQLVVSDLSSIESVVLAWCAESETLLDNFRNGIDSYKDYYVHLHRAKTGEVITREDVTKEQRFYAKPPTLGCGYMLGAKGLVAYADGMGVKMTEAEAKLAVNTFRTAYPDIPDFWQRIEAGAKRCIRNRDKTGVVVGHIRFRWDAPFMFMDLPSGRSLAYLRPKIEMLPAPWDKTQLIENITYEGQNQFKNNAWERISTHAGKITENAVQAIARDVLAAGMVEAEQEGFTIVGHVHDEIMATTPENDEHLTLDLLRDCMTRLPNWCLDMPLNAEGYVSRYFYKD